ncbi:E3 ubiquitin-protein transferase MAEA [Chironomus tepperi]|uniref:E3 ubiquitin-protein transferase MAEA n=1 Tax=Chironomus tepperi TaxID=113505 RepID=UPI00391F2BFE
MGSEIKSLEHPTLKVPYEILNKKFRTTQKTLDKELNSILQTAACELERGLDNAPIVGNISKLLDNVIEKLNVLKRKAEESIGDELKNANVCKKRLEHIKQNVCNTATLHNKMIIDGDENSNESQIAIAAANQWKKIRLNRLIVEHFLRLGYYDTAEILANRSGIRDITNIDIFQVSREVERDLSEHNTTKCIMWCMDNKSKLRKINSDIEFKLRQQEFIELIRKGERLNAVKHAQKFFPAFEQDQITEIKKSMALLAFPLDTELEPYRSMFDIKRWDELLVNYRLENYRLFQIPTQSVLSVAVQTGLSALKTPQCYSTNSRNINCPVCQPQINEIAFSLPFSHCAQSRLICRVTKKPLNENNHPMVLPNGFVVGELALSIITNQDGIVECPFTSEKWSNPKIEKVYVM